MKPSERPSKPTFRSGRVPALVVFLMCLGALGVATAQNVAAVATDEAVLLRWSLPGSVLPDNGFVLERRRTDTPESTPVIRAVASPMPQADAVAHGLVTPETYALLDDVFSATYQDDDADFTRAILTLSTLAHPDWAKALGVLVEDGDVEPGVRYLYRVSVAKPDFSAGALVGTVDVTAGEVRALPQVTGLDARVEAGAVHLTWRKPDENTLITAYDIYRRDPAGNERKLNADPHFIGSVDPDGGPGTSADDYVDANVTPGERYLYTVVGIDLFGRRAPSSEALALVVPDDRPLEVLAIGSDEVLDNAIRLHWTAASSPRTHGVAVLRSESPDGLPRQITVDALPPTATTYTDRTVRGGVTYYYALAGVDQAGRLGPLGPLWSQRGANFDPPTAPTDLHVDATEDHLHLGWTPPPEDDVAGYRIYTGADPDAPLEDYRFMAETLAPWYDQPVPKNTLRELHFRVVAVNSTNVASLASAAASGTVLDRTPPSRPVMREATVHDGAIEVSWLVTGDPDVQAYQLLRSAGEEPMAVVADGLPAATARYLDEDVDAGTTYRYAVLAVDASGNASTASAPTSAKAIDLSAADAPTGLVAIPAEDGVQLSWDASSAAGTRYVVERARGEGAAFVEISDVLDTALFVDPQGDTGDRYRVKALAASGRIGAPPEPVTVVSP